MPSLPNPEEQPRSINPNKKGKKSQGDIKDETANAYS
jgi:hypothetical protein